MNTMQQEFNAVVNHLYKQGRPAADDNVAGCYYRMEKDGETLSCAVGCRIPNGIYMPAMDGKGMAATGEGTALHTLIKEFGVILPAEIIAYRSMFAELQYLHDRQHGTYSSSFYSDLERIAEKFDLVFTKPEGI